MSAATVENTPKPTETDTKATATETKETEVPKENKPKKKAIKVPVMPKAEYNYTYCYCEENIYKLLEKLTLLQVLEKAKGEAGIGGQFDKMFAMFLSSFTLSDRAHEKQNEWASVVPLRVSAGDRSDVVCHVGGKDCFVTWDYHVVALLRSSADKSVWFVADFDTRHQGRPDPSCLLIPAEEYFARTFSFLDVMNFRPIPTRMNPKKLASTFQSVRARIVPSETFLTYFRTDRSHMRDKKGNYESAPPTYPAIDGPSPITAKLRPAGAPVPEPYKPQFKNLLTCYLNVSEQKDASLAQYLGEIVEIPNLGQWFADQSQ